MTLTHEMFGDAMKRLESLLANGPPLNTAFDTYEMLWLAGEIEEYENKYYPIEPPTPEAAAEFRLDQEATT